MFLKGGDAILKQELHGIYQISRAKPRIDSRIFKLVFQFRKEVLLATMSDFSRMEFPMSDLSYNITRRCLCCSAMASLRDGACAARRVHPRLCMGRERGAW